MPMAQVCDLQGAGRERPAARRGGARTARARGRRAGRGLLHRRGSAEADPGAQPPIILRFTILHGAIASGRNMQKRCFVERDGTLVRRPPSADRHAFRRWSTPDAAPSAPPGFKRAWCTMCIAFGLRHWARYNFDVARRCALPCPTSGCLRSRCRRRWCTASTTAPTRRTRLPTPTRCPHRAT